MCPPGREFDSRHLHPQTPEDSAVFASLKTVAEMKNAMNHQTQTETTPPQDGTVYSELSLKFANRKEVLKSALLGAFIGLAIIVPGVSGSAVAIIFRLYEKLLFALGNESSIKLRLPSLLCLPDSCSALTPPSPIKLKASGRLRRGFCSFYSEWLSRFRFR